MDICNGVLLVQFVVLIQILQLSIVAITVLKILAHCQILKTLLFDESSAFIWFIIVVADLTHFLFYIVVGMIFHRELHSFSCVQECFFPSMSSFSVLYNLQVLEKGGMVLLVVWAIDFVETIFLHVSWVFWAIHVGVLYKSPYFLHLKHLKDVGIYYSIFS